MNTISVIVPLYNGKKYIVNLMKAVLANLKRSASFFQIEMIFVNDNPEEVIEESELCVFFQAAEKELAYKPLDNMFSYRLLTNRMNQGIHFARVVGLQNASGQFVHFLDQDDRITDCFYASHLRKIGKKDVSVGNGYTQEGTGDKRLYRFYLMQWTVKHIYFYAKYDNRILSPGQCLIRKDSIPAEWTNQLLKNSGSDDYFLWLLMLSKKRKMAINREYVYVHVHTQKNYSLNLDAIKASVMEVCANIREIVPNIYVAMIKKRMHAPKSRFVKMIEQINAR